MNCSLLLSFSEMRLGTMQEVEEAMMHSSESTAAAMSVHTLIFRSRRSGTHSWMYMEPWQEMDCFLRNVEKVMAE